MNSLVFINSIKRETMGCIHCKGLWCAKFGCVCVLEDDLIAGCRDAEFEGDKKSAAHHKGVPKLRKENAE